MAHVDPTRVEDAADAVYDTLPIAARKRLYRIAKRVLPLLGVVSFALASLGNVLDARAAGIASAVFLVASGILHGIADRNTDPDAAPPSDAAVGS